MGGGGVAAAALPPPPTEQQILEATLPLTAAGGAAGALGDGMPVQGPPSRHLWVGNMPVKPNKAAIEAAFASFGPVESVWTSVLPIGTPHLVISRPHV